jgi:DNA-directed RNA polymerase subunit N (RpoN/RPB10)
MSVLTPPPVRCFTCGGRLGDLWLPYWRHMRSGCTEFEAATLVGLELKKYCCRGILEHTVPSNGLAAPPHPPEGSTYWFRSVEMMNEPPKEVRYVNCV